MMMCWAENGKDEKNVYRILVGKPQRERPLGKQRHTWVDNIKTDLGETGRSSMDWTDTAPDRVMNLWVQ
jgi:hypothetical protein